jgi:hypothetical protein
MTEQQAKQNGYHHHGAYSRDKEEMKQRAAQLRSEGNKAVVCTIPHNPLSRGGGGNGYSIYWIESDANKATREAEQRAKNLRYKIAERDELLAKLAEVNAQIEQMQA